MPAQVLPVDHICGSRGNGSQLVKGTLKQQRRVLVVDDSSDGRWMISSILKCLGMEVATVASGREGCEAAMSAVGGKRPFDLVLMDWQMPEMDGCEATVRLRSGGYSGRIVALLSPSSFGQIDASWQRAGCDGFASKPITFEMLQGVVRRHVPEPVEAGRLARTGRSRALAS
jgi:CheY-like chemotaxis protein